MKLVFTIFFLFSNQLLFSQGLMEEIFKQGEKLNDLLMNATSLSDDEENQIGEAFFNDYLKNSHKIKEYKFDVNSIFNKLIRNVSRKRIKYEYVVVKSNEVNAFSLPGGKIIINSKLLDFVNSPDELAFIIAHEISHIELKHCVKKVQLAVRAGQINPTLGNVVGSAYNFTQIPFNKYDEFAADKNGIALLKKCGYSKDGAVNFFTKLIKLEKEKGIDKQGSLEEFISTHPKSTDRKQRIEKM